MKKGTLLIIPLIGTIVEHSKEPIMWVKGVFHALRSITTDGIYSIIVVNNSSFNSQQVGYITESLVKESIQIEAIINTIDELKSDEIDTRLTLSLIPSQGIFCYEGFNNWEAILLKISTNPSLPQRIATLDRKTKETSIEMSVNLDGSGKSSIETGLPFFNHMLDQIAKHGRLDISLTCNGDIEVDEHHSVEDVAIVFGSAIYKGLGDKKGIRRYGEATIPMDDVTSTVAIDFSNRPYFVWNVEFSRDVVGTFPTEMVYHFFKSFSDEARCNLHMSVTNGNTHHQVEALFKAFARAIREAIFRYPGINDLPSTKGAL